MNKIVWLLMPIFLAAHIVSHAQRGAGSVSIDPYVGFPTEHIFLSNEIDNFGAWSIGSPVSFGGRAEYMFVNKLGIGFDVNYAIAGYQYIEQNFYNPTTQVYSDALYEYRVEKLRAMLRFNYHFVQTSDFDLYTGFGFGYRYVTRSSTYDGVPANINPIFVIVDSDWPVSFRFAFGAKYYFAETIGAFLELGTSGGGVAQFGFTIDLINK